MYCRVGKFRIFILSKVIFLLKNAYSESIYNCYLLFDLIITWCAKFFWVNRVLSFDRRWRVVKMELINMRMNFPFGNWHSLRVKMHKGFIRDYGVDRSFSFVETLGTGVDEPFSFAETLGTGVDEPFSFVKTLETRVDGTSWFLERLLYRGRWVFQISGKVIVPG